MKGFPFYKKIYIMNVVINMSNEMKKQLLLSLTIFMVVLGTLIFWYDNFVFHTYVEQIEYQECLQGQNDDFIVQGYEFYQHNQKSYFGNERLIALNDHLLMKDDTVKLTLVASVSTKQKYELTQTYRVKSQNEVCVFDQSDNNEHLDFSKFKEMALKIQVQRKNKAVYNQTMDLKKLKLTAYNGGNKNYTIQNVYASSQWLKTGIFSSTDNDLTKNYQRCVVDYMLLKADGDEDNIDDYERIVNISQSTKELIDNPKQTTYFYDGEGSLLDRQLRCVVTLMKDEQDQHPLVFVIDLHGAIKEGITDGKI